MNSFRKKQPIFYTQNWLDYNELTEPTGIYCLAGTLNIRAGAKRLSQKAVNVGGAGSTIAHFLGILLVRDSWNSLLRKF